MSDETQPKNGEALAGSTGASAEGGEQTVAGTTSATPQEGAEKLSQDEVQALLRGVEDGDVVAEGAALPDGQCAPTIWWERIGSLVSAFRRSS